jgi:phage I-like protein/2'-5' RNA ligase
MPTPKPHSGACVVLPVPARLAARLALPGGEPAADLHVSLAYIGEAAGIEPETRDTLRARLAALAAGAAPLDALLGGVGRFSGDEADALYLSVDAHELGPLRALVLAACERAGAKLDTTHGFNPHLTLAYLAHDDASPYDRAEPERVRFGELALWLGEERAAWPLGAPSGEQLAARAGVVVLDALGLPDDFPPREIRLFVRGMNRTTKGDFLLDDEALSSVLAAFEEHGVDLAIDFDHGTFSEPGAKKDTAGWIGALEAREDGLYATQIHWTEKGLAAISPGAAPDGTPTPPEYRYHSPAIQFDADTRRITRLEPLGLVTFPASKGQRPLVMAATTTTARGPARTETRPMKNRTALLSTLKLADTATDDEIMSSLTSLKGALEGALAALSKLMGAAGVQMNADAPLDEKKIEETMGALAALKGSTTALDAQAKRIAQLEATIDGDKRDAIIAKLRADKKCTPAQAEHLRTQTLSAVEGFAKTAPVIGSLADSERVPAEPQKGGAGAGGTGTEGVPFEKLTATQKAAFSQRDPDGYRVAREAWLASNPRANALLGARSTNA